MDVWEHLRHGEPGWTEDTDVNEMRFIASGKHKQVRFDRVLQLCKEEDGPPHAKYRAEPEGIRLLGTEKIAEVTVGHGEWAEAMPIWPSDHFGLSAQFVMGGDTIPLQPMEATMDAITHATRIN